ncbi:ABC-type metal ion transport system, periplasmic component/surface adhesin [Cenarchaeum symbiosum A]|uniref:ABC-type metal ion transport system, periplasmic component/surface adhesin n=1 Tax=Cenarchaeum symbiosum (strain A) TaxID=414004 RepID=A0RWG9_CENSY|nr:ABC-type metal ion transport system, periplasmic component/surface adhesin [Cenarchaeum symbiosum A]
MVRPMVYVISGVVAAAVIVAVIAAAVPGSDTVLEGAMAPGDAAPIEGTLAPGDAAPIERTLVVASFFPYYELARNVAGDAATVEQLTPTGAGAHGWEPGARELQLLKDADVFVYNGLGMEPYVESLRESGEFDHVVFVGASEDLLLGDSSGQNREHDDHDGEARDHDRDDDHERDDDHGREHDDDDHERDDDHGREHDDDDHERDDDHGREHDDDDHERDDDHGREHDDDDDHGREHDDDDHERDDDHGREHDDDDHERDDDHGREHDDDDDHGREHDDDDDHGREHDDDDDHGREHDDDDDHGREHDDDDDHGREHDDDDDHGREHDDDDDHGREHDDDDDHGREHDDDDDHGREHDDDDDHGREHDDDHGREHDDDEGDSGHGHAHHGPDPHTWIDPVLAQKQVLVIESALSAADPENAGTYSRNAAEYNLLLDGIDRDMQSLPEECGVRLVSFHAAPTHLAERYGLDLVSMGQEPDLLASASEIAGFIEAARGTGVILADELADPRLPESMASEAGARVVPFSTIEAVTPEESAAGVTLLDKMEQNVDSMEEALGCR